MCHRGQCQKPPEKRSPVLCHSVILKNRVTYIRQRLDSDAMLILVPNYSTEAREALGAMLCLWEALLPPGLRSIPRGVWVLPLLLFCQRDKRCWSSFLPLPWVPHSELTLLPKLHIFPMSELLLAGESDWDMKRECACGTPLSFALKTTYSLMLGFLTAWLNHKGWYLQVYVK